MNILLIHLDNDEKTAARLPEFLRGNDFVIKTLPLSENAGTSPEAQLRSFFVKANSDAEGNYQVVPAQTLVVSALPTRCLDFLAGYSSASSSPFRVYGEDAVNSIPNDLSGCFTTIETEADLLKIFKDMEENYLKIESEKEYRKAKEKLLEIGIPMDLESLSNCAAKGRIYELTLFLAAGFSPDARNVAGVPLLNVAARKGNRETLRLLIQAGAKLDSISEDRGSTPLIDSVIGNHAVVARELVKAGADVNVINKSGQTALIVAVGAGDQEMVETLLKAGADPDQKDSMGVSARKYATLFHKEKLVNLFETITPPKAE